MKKSTLDVTSLSELWFLEAPNFSVYLESFLYMYKNTTSSLLMPVLSFLRLWFIVLEP